MSLANGCPTETTIRKQWLKFGVERKKKWNLFLEKMGADGLLSKICKLRKVERQKKTRLTELPVLKVWLHFCKPANISTSCYKSPLLGLASFEVPNLLLGRKSSAVWLKLQEPVWMRIRWSSEYLWLATKLPEYALNLDRVACRIWIQNMEGSLRMRI